jgi:nucleoside-diphosphate-sugar epimerase
MAGPIPHAMSSQPTILVTGATSQIGKFLLPRLVASGYSVVAVSRQINGGDGRGITWLAVDIRSPGCALPAAQVLIHLAPLNLLPPLLPGFLKSGGKRLICFGTTSRYIKAASADAGEQAFATGQVAAERDIAAACAKAEARWTLFRPTLIYGAGMDRNVSLIARIIGRFGFFPLFGRAIGRRQPVHADDLAVACVAALNSPRSFDKAYDLAGGETLSYRDMVTRIFAALGRKPRFVHVPMGLFRIAMGLISLLPRFLDFNAEMARRMNDDLVFDSSAAMRDFGYAPRPFRPTFTALSEDAVSA